MKNRALKIILNAVIGIVSVAVFVLLFFSLRTDYFPALWYSLAGLVGAYLLNAIIHELAHVISGAIVGLKPYSVQILNLFIGKDETGKFRFAFRRSYGELGSTVFMPKTSVKVYEKHAISSLVALSSNLAILIAQCVIANASTNLVVVSTVGITFPVTLYLFLINFIPVFDNDGKILYSFLLGGKNLQIAKNYHNALAELTLGTTPENLNSQYLIIVGDSPYSVGIRYLRYLAYLKNDEEGAIKELMKISDISALPSISEDIEKELFFSAILLGNDKYIKECEDRVVGLLEKQFSPTDYRIHASYRIKTGEVEWAKLILNSGIEYCKTYPNKGLALSEEAYMNSIKNQLK